VVAIVAMILTAGIAGAALVSVYFTVTGTVNVETSLSVHPGTYEITTRAGSIVAAYPQTVTNKANMPIEARMESTVLDENGTEVTDGIFVYYYKGAVEPLDIEINQTWVLPQHIVFEPGETELVPVVVTSPALEPGNYTITTNAVPVPMVWIANQGNIE